MGGNNRMDPVVVRGVLDLLAQGQGPMDVARATGVSKTFIYDLRASLGGVFRPPGTTCSDRYLQREERYELARLVETGCHSLRQVATLMGRDVSTLSRELRRNRCPRTGRYVPETAERLAWAGRRRPKRSKLGGNPRLRARVQAMLTRRYSPEQVAGRLRVEHPEDEQMRISHESIYQSIYLYPRGELRRELQAQLRTRRAQRQRRGRVERRGTIPGLVSIHDRPQDVEGRCVPGHHEGDLIMGARASNSAIGTLVERCSGYLTLLHLPDGHGAASVAAEVTTQLTSLPTGLAKTLTWDRGTEMTQHTKITHDTGIRVYFADPYSPWQRGSNENTNGLLREYFPKSTDLSTHTRDDLQRVADELNNRPRKRLGYLTPNEVIATLLAHDQPGVATTP